MKPAWTGGQHSLVRAVAAVALAGLFLQSDLRWWFGVPLATGALAHAAGAGGRAIAALLALLLPFALGDPRGNSTVALFEIWLLVQLGMPPAPFGSLAAVGRTSPAGDWSMPVWYAPLWQAVFVATRLGVAVQSAMAGSAWKSAAYALPGVLALVPGKARTAWSISLVVSLGFVLGEDGRLVSTLLLHLFVFQPAWLPAREAGGASIVFYDGTCALCHGAVRFLLAEDRDPAIFRFAPLDSEAFVRLVPERERAARPDSIVVLHDDEVLLRGQAVIAILDALGGIWRVTAALLRVLPRSAVDAGYDAVAARRYRWFGRKSESCPLMPASFRARFEA